MQELEPGDVYSPEPNILERRAADYLTRSNGRATPQAARSRDADDGGLRRVTRGAIAVSAGAGIVSGGLIGGTEVWIRQGVFDGMEGVPWREQLPYWIGFFAFAGVISAIEIVFLYWVALRGAVRTTDKAGLALGAAGHPHLFARGLARGALEFPNPRALIFGIDPYAYVPRWRLAVTNIAYKTKVGVSSFLLRVFMRRVLARVAVRGLVPLIAGPLYAAWNAIIIWRIMREARLRTFGPLAVETLIEDRIASGARPDAQVAQAILHGAGEMTRRASDAHPNLVYLLARLREELDGPAEIDVDWTRQCEALGSLGRHEQAEVLDVLVLTALLCSKVSSYQREMLRHACATCGATFKPESLKRLRAKLLDGRPIDVAELAEVRP